LYYIINKANKMLEKGMHRDFQANKHNTVSYEHIYTSLNKHTKRTLGSMKRQESERN